MHFPWRGTFKITQSSHVFRCRPNTMSDHVKSDSALTSADSGPTVGLPSTAPTPGERTGGYPIRAPARALSSPGVFDRYELGANRARRYGRGGAQIDTTFGREVAVKMLLADPAGRPHLVRRFVEEARITGLLQHPGVPPVHDLGTLPDGRPFLAMKLIQGRTLAALLRERPPPTAGVPDAQTCRVSCRCSSRSARRWRYAHSKGVIHRDLKPANVMVGAFGEVQVMDWGLAKELRGPTAANSAFSQSPAADTADPFTTTDLPQEAGEATCAGTVLGTPAYMPPEQARGEIDRLDARADVFALGGILCEILTGSPAYTGSEARAVFVKATSRPTRRGVRTAGGLGGRQRPGWSVEAVSRGQARTASARCGCRRGGHRRLPRWR